METRYITDEGGERVGVILSMEAHERIMDELEDLEASRAAGETRAAIERGEEEVIPWEQAMREIREGKGTEQ